MPSPKPSEGADLWRAVLVPAMLGSGLLLALYLATVTWQLPFPRDAHDYALGRDFLNFWSYGREAWGPAAGRFYDIWAYDAHNVALTGWDYPIQQWSYPPHLMLLMAPFGLLPYLPAYLLWTVLGVLALGWAAPEGFGRSRGTLALLLAPAGLICLVSGQNAFFTLALLVAIFRSLDARPVLAGILLGVLSVKPQLGLLFPLMLIMTGRWTVFGWAALTTTALAVATALIWGPGIWVSYLTVGVSTQEYVIRDPTLVSLALMPTAYMNGRILGLSAEAAYGVQFVFAAFAIAAMFWTFWRRRDPLRSFAILVTASLVATPYLMSYDLVIVAWLLLALYGSNSPSGRERPLLLAVYALPFIGIAGGILGVPGSAMVLVALLCFLVATMRKQESGSERAGYPVQPVSVATAAAKP